MTPEQRARMMAMRADLVEARAQLLASTRVRGAIKRTKEGRPGTYLHDLMTTNRLIDQLDQRLGQRRNRRASAANDAA